METFELIPFITNNLINGSLVSGIVGSIITAVFLRKNTSVEEFEKIKAGKFDAIVDDLLTAEK